ncbi:hypothetical protein O0L34_g19388 [Tuta absoluta]|nr:hypothetical protein O0L34_g19388 [Tuta absoluta]
MPLVKKVGEQYIMLNTEIQFQCISTTPVVSTNPNTQRECTTPDSLTLLIPPLTFSRELAANKTYDTSNTVLQLGPELTPVVDTSNSVLLLHPAPNAAVSTDSFSKYPTPHMHLPIPPLTITKEPFDNELHDNTFLLLQPVKITAKKYDAPDPSLDGSPTKAPLSSPSLLEGLIIPPDSNETAAAVPLSSIVHSTRSDESPFMAI